MPALNCRERNRAVVRSASCASRSCNLLVIADVDVECLLGTDLLFRRVGDDRPLVDARGAVVEFPRLAAEQRPQHGLRRAPQLPEREDALPARAAPRSSRRSPNRRPTGSGSSVAVTSSARMTVRPSGLCISEASFASSLLCETPTEAVSPVRSRMRFLISRAMSSPLPKRPVLAVTSRKASSSDSPSTRSVNSRKISNTCAEISR